MTQGAAPYLWADGLTYPTLAGRGLALVRPGAPAAPGAPTPTAGNGQVSLAATPPAGTILEHEFEASDGQTRLTTSLPYTFVGLVNGNVYTFRYRARNSVGWSPWSVASAAVSPTGSGSGQLWATVRDAYKHPFLSALDDPDSIWNRPIGTGAQFLDAGLDYADAWNPHGWPHGMVTTDKEHVSVDPAAPVKTLTVTQSGGLSGTAVRVRTDLAHDGKLNGCAVLLVDSDGYEIIQGQPLVVVAGGNPSWKHTIRSGETVHLKTDGEASRGGSHGGSKLSAYGGSIKQGELNGPDPIRHPLKINVFGRRFLSRDSNGFRWPAYSADAKYNDPTSTNGYYDGPIPDVRMGSLLALPIGHDLSWVTHAKVLKIATCMKHYGAYIVDNTAWDVHAFNIDKRVDASGEWPRTSSTSDRTFHQELQRLITELYVVTNNASGQQVSGGGSPVANNLHAPSVFL